MTTSHADTARRNSPRRRWYQFSLRTMLVGMVVIGFGTAWLSLQVKRALDQRRAVKAIAAVAEVWFAEPRTWAQRNKYLRSWLGDDAILDVYRVVFRQAQGEELELALSHLRGLTQLEWLDLSDTQVSDAGLAHLRGLTQLQTLDLSNAQVSDAELSQLSESLPQLSEAR
jgi:hypothetical protein